MKKIVITAHKYFPQPDDDLVFYLNSKKADITHIRHSFPDAKDRRSCCLRYSKGKKIEETKTLDFKFLPEPLVFLKEFFFTVKWLVFSKRKWDLYIGMDGLCAFFGIFLKWLGVCQKVIYWSIDFVPRNRFKSSWKNFIYHQVNSYACKNSDEVWDLSPRMLEGREKYLGIKKKDYQKHRIVPYGVWTKRIKKIPFEKCQKSTLVFMGHLLPKQGVDVVIKKIPAIVKKIPDFRFKIIGGGNYQKFLMRLTKELSLEGYVNFLGRLGNKELEKDIAKSAVAIAPYLKTEDSYTYYADSGKLKTYLACGVPVLLTDLPWNAREIERKKCGLIIGDEGGDLVGKLVFLMNPKTNKEYRKNATDYSQQFDYESIFSQLKF